MQLIKGEEGPESKNDDILLLYAKQEDEESHDGDYKIKEI